MTANGKASAALGRVVLLRVERLDKLCHLNSPFRKVPTIKAVGFAYLVRIALFNIRNNAV
jgi:hypothetical protein